MSGASKLSDTQADIIAVMALIAIVAITIWFWQTPA